MMTPMKRSAGMSVVAVSGSSQTARRIVDRATEKSEEAPRVSPDNQSILAWLALIEATEASIPSSPDALTAVRARSNETLASSRRRSSICDSPMVFSSSARSMEFSPYVASYVGRARSIKSRASASSRCACAVLASEATCSAHRIGGSPSHSALRPPIHRSSSSVVAAAAMAIAARTRRATSAFRLPAVADGSPVEKGETPVSLSFWQRSRCARSYTAPSVHGWSGPRRASRSATAASASARASVSFPCMRSASPMQRLSSVAASASAAQAGACAAGLSGSAILAAAARQ
mmetsp:Transcript_25081/g.76160  ORF Transcript_25081/g.76160 Transcript_25081/m.76160 type:complete len:290 (+) Transcript_25081:1057-1926(+)